MTGHHVEECIKHLSIAGGSQSFTATIEIIVADPWESRSRYISRSNYTILMLIPKNVFIQLQRHLLIHV